MSDPAGSRINSAFDEELAAAPVPPGLRAVAVRAAVAAPQRGFNQPELVALVATLLAVAIVATLVIGAHVLRSTPIPAGSTTPPVPRAGAAVTYDGAHGVMVVFGGNYRPHPPSNETWTWDGRYWRQQHPAISPSARNTAVMTYDVARRDVVLFGGLKMPTGGNNLPILGDTWVWNGSSWAEKNPKHEPALGYDWHAPSMAFDPITNTLLMYGITTDHKPQTRSWNGSDWTQLSPSTTPASVGTLVSDGNQVLLLAESPGLVGRRFATQTWAWEGANWNLLHPKVDLPVIAFPSAAYDAARGKLVVVTGDTWTWDGSTWSRQHPAVQPPIGYVVYMSSLREVVSWGDLNSDQGDDMWAWNGSNWTLMVPLGTTVVPHVATPGAGKSGYLGRMPPDEAVAAVRAAVINTRPVLLPSSPPNWAYVATVNASLDGFEIRYQSDLRDKLVEFGIVVPNPPPGTSASSERLVSFRGVTASYFVYDTSAPLSQRWLMWTEPGTTADAQVKRPGGLPYFLSASGLTDAEFWQFANSLR